MEDPATFQLEVTQADLRLTTVPLGTEELRVGRDSDNQLVLSGGRVSRSHCRLWVDAGQVWIEDLGSANGTYLNGELAQRAPVRPGDVVEVGSYRIELRDMRAEDRLVLLPNTQQFLPRLSERAPEATPRSRLAILLELVEQLDLGEPPRAVLGKLLEGLLSALQAERVALFAYDTDGRTVTRIDERLATDAVVPAPVSRNLVLEVARRREPCLIHALSEDLEGLSVDADLPSIQRLAGEDVRSIMVVPLIQGSRLTGILYLDGSQARRAFDREDLELLGRASSYLAGIVLAQENQAALLRENSRLRRSVQRARGEVPQRDLFVSASPMAEVVAIADRAAETTVSVLITGETGSGKEVMARRIHDLSERADGPFLAVNCGAIPEGLVESELFGHVKGAFSGAAGDRVGLIELASGGTLFLDEVGELPPALQVKLLRVIEERRLRRLGEGRDRKVDFRLVSATHQDLVACARAGTFREDLFYRLAVLKIELPPLRSRPMDLELLVEHLIETLASEMGSAIRQATPEYLETLRGYTWPGNIRQLRNVIERSLVLETGDRLSVEVLPQEVRGGSSAGFPPSSSSDPAKGVGLYGERLEEFERAYFSALHAEVGDNVSAMSRRAGITRVTLYRKLKLYRILARHAPASS